MANPIDLYSLKFWAVVVVCSLLVVPLTSPRLRSWALALVNLGFVCGYLRPGGPIAVLLVGIVALYVFLRLTTNRQFGALALQGQRFGRSGILRVAQAPWLADTMGLSILDPVLAVVGFSYVALRFVDVARGVADGKNPAPGLATPDQLLAPVSHARRRPDPGVRRVRNSAGRSSPRWDQQPSLGALDRIAAGMFKKFILAQMIQKIFLTDFRVGRPLLPARNATELPLAVSRLQCLQRCRRGDRQADRGRDAGKLQPALPGAERD